MKIILSVQPVKYPLTGIGRYTYELGRVLPGMEGLTDVRFFDETGFVPNLEASLARSAEAPARPSKLQALKRFVAKSQFAVDAYRFLRRRTKDDALKGYSDFLYHGPNFYLPEFDGPSVVTMHDLSVLTMPQFHPRERVHYLTREMESAARRATRIVTDSHYIKSEIIEHFGFEDSRVGVAHLACSDDFRPRSAAEVMPVLAPYRLSPQGYTLYTGTIEPRKNIAQLIEAYGRLPRDLRQAYPLVLAGYKGWNNEAIMERIAAAEREGWLRYLGFVPDEHLPSLFSGARLFAFPSLYEGFGLPILEAMASAVPVVTSNRASLPEVGGESVGYCDPDDIEALTELCERGLTDEDWRRSATEKGLRQAATFSWRRCAEETVAVYRAALGS